MDLKTLTTEELDQHRVEVLTECERRQKMEAIPGQVRDLATDYKQGGGDPDDLVKVITTPDE